MANVPVDSKPFTLRRWSQRKLAARDVATARNDAETAVVPPSAAVPADPGRAALAITEPGDVVADAPTSEANVSTAPAAPDTLPALDSLTIDSDFTAFMRPGVDDSVKRGALKKLFSDPHFNVMDGLDVYVGDYSKPDPIDPAVVRTLTQARYIFNPPATQLNAQGYVEDVPDEPVSGDRAPADDAEAPDGQVGTSPSTADEQVHTDAVGIADPAPVIVQVDARTGDAVPISRTPAPNAEADGPDRSPALQPTTTGDDAAADPARRPDPT